MASVDVRHLTRFPFMNEDRPRTRVPQRWSRLIVCKLRWRQLEDSARNFGDFYVSRRKAWYGGKDRTSCPDHSGNWKNMGNFIKWEIAPSLMLLILIFRKQREVNYYFRSTCFSRSLFPCSLFKQTDLAIFHCFLSLNL